MKRLRALMLALVMACAVCAQAAAEEAETRPYYMLEELGIQLYVDAEWEQYARAYDVTLECRTDYGEDGALDRGMVMLLPAEYDNSTESSVSFLPSGGILGVGVRSAEAQAEYEDFAGYASLPLGEVGDYRFTLYINRQPDTSLLDDEGRAMDEAVRGAIEPAPENCFRLSAPATLEELNTLVPEFSAQDVFGNEVDRSVLDNAPYTLIDVWATYCSPCISEMPELEQLANEYAGRVQFIGIVADATDDATVELAREIVEKTGVGYTCIVPDDALGTRLIAQIQYTPTKLIVTSSGVLAAEPLIGAQGAEALRQVLDALPAAE